jgi:hypothetical protein
MTISGWKAWPYLASMLCFPLGLLLSAANGLFDAGISPVLPFVLLLVGMPSAIIELVASLRTGNITLVRGRSSARGEEDGPR